MPEKQLPDVEEGDEQRRDAMLLKLLKTPPKQRPKRERKPTPKPSSSATARKREPSV
jgi:hypothetical protein